MRRRGLGPSGASQGFFYRLQRRPLLAHGAEQFAGLLVFPFGHRGFRRALHFVGHLVNPVQHVGNGVFGGAGLAASALTECEMILNGK